MNRIVENYPPPALQNIKQKDWAQPWNLVRADANIRNDVLVGGTMTTLTLQRIDPLDPSRFQVVGNPPPAFVGCTLELKGTQAPDIDAASPSPLPPYSEALDGHYISALDDHLIPYLKADMARANGGDLLRLEGVIQVRCCWPQAGTRLAELNPQPHFVKTDVRLYQFDEGMLDGAPGTSTSSTLLVVWAPDSPRLPVNPDGSAVGFS
jgi:hypothetical protein